ncbi:hypothetical protein ACHWQZ_G006220 [Mnemiopsis leidyi]
MSSFSEDYQTIVLDVGACSTKVGYSDIDTDDPEPQAVVPTLVGVPINPDIPVMGCKSYFVGDEARKIRGSLKLTRPIRNGIIHDWDAFEEILQCAFMNELRANPAESSILMADKMFSPRKQRERICEMMFEQFDVQGYFVALQSLLPMFDNEVNRETALIVDIGHDITEITPVHEGFVLVHQARRTGISGRSVDEKLAQLLTETTISSRGDNLHRRLLSDTLNDLELVREVKEGCCHVALDCQEKRLEYEVDTVVETFQLPDGSEILLDEECFRAPEVLFDPSIIGSTAVGLSQLIYDTIMSCPIETRRSLYQNIVLVGGTSTMNGLPERIEQDLSALAPESIHIDLGIADNADTVTWTGGSCLASSVQFGSSLLSRDHYDEYGSGIIHSKFYFDDKPYSKSLFS